MQENDRGDLSIRLRGARLRQLRIRCGFRTQGALAAVLGCARSTVATWEASASIPRPDMLGKLCALLCVPVSELIEECGGPSLRSMRTAAGLRQVDMAGFLKISPSAYCDVETGRQAIPARWFPVLASVFGRPERDVRAMLNAGGRGAVSGRPRTG
ncbi:helix-turn-helix transcriptional regulator [Streptomyces pharetrae]|uniref:helix-turn-helix transcriptional regulator n=1 Tax=Streptomyces pharetrae TaxID=291370 RepID=UPI00334DCA73